MMRDRSELSDKGRDCAVDGDLRALRWRRIVSGRAGKRGGDNAVTWKRKYVAGRGG